jgi:hypothetical protein
MMLCAVHFTLTTFVAMAPAFAWPKWEQFAKIVLMSMIVPLVIYGQFRIRWLVIVIALSLGFYGFKGGIFTLAHGGIYHIQGPEGTFIGDNNSIALALVMTLPLLQWLAGTTPQPWMRRLYLLTMWLSAISAAFTYSRGGWIPILSAFDLGVHEFGHLLTAWAPPLLCSLAGSVLQVAAPLALGVYFWWRRDHFAVILMVAWAAENLHNVSVYIADARVMVLPLFGDDGSGAGHDWHTILLRLNALEVTGQLALVVTTCSVILFITALGLAVLGFARARRAPLRP